MKELLAQLSVLLVVRQLLLDFFVGHSVDCFAAEHMRLGNQTIITCHRCATARGAHRDE